MADDSTNIIGKNTVSGEHLRSFVERLERLKADKKSITDDEAAVKAEIKSAGFHPKAVTQLVKIRAMKPQDRQEAEAIMDLYLHSMDMIPEMPLFRAIENMAVDTLSRESVIEAMKRFVPQNGSITIEIEGKPVRLTRDPDGSVHETEVVERPAPVDRAAPKRTSAPKGDVPNVTPDAAEALGAEAYKANTAIIANPFPFDDERRPRWDKGWRVASGSTGMGEDDEEEKPD